MFSFAPCFASRVTEEEGEVHALLIAAFGEGIHEYQEVKPGFSDDEERGGGRQAGAHVAQSSMPGRKPTWGRPGL